MTNNIKGFLDEDGRLKQLPRKQTKFIFCLEYLATKFDPEKQYTEPEVNQILTNWHTFGDYFILRRSLIDEGYLLRKTDGSCYWVNPEKKLLSETDQKA